MENMKQNTPDKAEEEIPATPRTDQKPEDQVEQSDAVIGDVHPTERTETFQEQMNAELENKSDDQ